MLKNTESTGRCLSFCPPVSCNPEGKPRPMKTVYTLDITTLTSWFCSDVGRYHGNQSVGPGLREGLDQ